MSRVNRAVLCLVLCLSFFNGGCKFVDAEVLKGIHEYFPKGELHKYNPRILHIETKVGNVTKKFADKTFQGLIGSPEGTQLRQGMMLAGYDVLVLGFDDYNVVWFLKKPDVFWTMNGQQFVEWYVPQFGRPPANYPILK